MKIRSLREPPKRRSFWRALVVALVAHPSAALLLIGVYWLLRPFVWAAIYMQPYSPPPGPYPPGSGEWLFTQGIGFCASVVAGMAAGHWSPPESHVPIAVLVVLSLALLLFTHFPLEASLLHNAIYALQTPLGLIVGTLLLKHLRANGDRPMRNAHDLLP